MTNERNERNQKIIDEFRSHAGHVGGHFEGKSLLLLHTQGAKSQQERINPLAYVKDNGHFVVIASKGGAPTNPDWYYNLLADPMVTIEVGTDKFRARAEPVENEPQRTQLYEKMIEMMPGFATYRQKTDRKIPVILLTPVL